MNNRYTPTPTPSPFQLHSWDTRRAEYCLLKVISGTSRLRHVFYLPQGALSLILNVDSSCVWKGWNRQVLLEYSNSKRGSCCFLPLVPSASRETLMHQKLARCGWNGKAALIKASNLSRAPGRTYAPDSDIHVALLCLICTGILLFSTIQCV